MIGADVLAAEAATDHGAVVVREVGEAAKAGDVSDRVDAVGGFQRFGVDLDPPALGGLDAGGLKVKAAEVGLRPVATRRRSQ